MVLLNDELEECWREGEFRHHSKRLADAVIMVAVSSSKPVSL